MDKLKGSCETLADFRKRNTSTIFSSWRPKKEKNHEKSANKKKFGSKSIFSTLMLANVEDRLIADPSGTMESISFDAQKEKLRTKLARVTLEKPSHNAPQIIVTSPENPKNSKQKNKNIEEAEEEEDDDDDDEIVVSKPVSFIVLNVDPYILDIYQDVMYDILYHLNISDDNDEPEIKPETALSYLQDAFGIFESKHQELLEKVKERAPTEVNANEDDDSHDKSFCVLTPKVKNYENLIAHGDLMKILLKHELETSKTPRHYWTGKFSFLASKILSLHAEFQFLDELHVSFAKWMAFTDIHQQYPLSLQVFNELLDQTVDVYKDEDLALSTLPMKSILPSNALSFFPACFGFSAPVNGMKMIEYKSRCSDHLKTSDSDVVEHFWNSSSKLQNAFLKFIHDIHYDEQTSDVDDQIIKIIIVKNIFEIVKRIEKIFAPKDIEQKKFVELVKQALFEGSTEHLNKNVNRKALKQTKNDETRLNELIRLIKFTEEHYKKIVNEFENVFESFFEFKFSEHLYNVYDSQLACIIKPIVIEISNKKEGNIDNFKQNDQAIATKLFELYCVIKSFSDDGLEFYYGNCEFHMRDYTNWFSAGIDKWCKVSVFSATARIDRAIEVDNLKPELKDSKRSSSAIDTIQILYSVKKFWEKVEWPDANKEAEIIKHVAADLSRFAIDYFDKFSQKVQKCAAMNVTGIFYVPVEMSVAIANFDYISKEIQTLIKEQMKDKVHDGSSIEKVIGNTLTYVDDITNQLLEITLKKSNPTIQKFLIEGAQVNSQCHDIADRLMTYIEDMLNMLHSDLPEKTFESAKSILWSEILQIFSESIQVSIIKQQQPLFFSNLRKILTVLKKIFKFNNDSEDEVMTKKVERIEYLLECYGLNTSRLIHQYFKDRYELQQQIHKSPFNPYGVLTCYCFFIGNTLKLEILNARNLIPIGPNRKCDPFVKVQLIPDKYFSALPSYKTKVQQNTHFPLFDEIFEFILTEEQRKMNEAIIFFNIKDKYLIGSNECIAEAFLSFKDIPEYTSKDKLHQIHLTLTRLQCDELESLKALQQRAQNGNDKVAKDFLSKLRSRTLVSPKKLKLPVTQL